MVITFEGNEGSGKSTAIKAVSEYLTQKGIPNIILREPGSNKIAEQIRNVILDKNNNAMDGMTEMLLYIAARRQNIKETIIPEIEKGNVVLIDRFYDSTYAYQVSGRGMSKDLCDFLHKAIFEGFKVDKTIYFDISYKEGMERIISNSRETNRMDEQGLQFYQKVEEGYLNRIKEDPTRFEVVNARFSKENVAKQCIEKILNILNIQ